MTVKHYLPWPTHAFPRSFGKKYPGKALCGVCLQPCSICLCCRWELKLCCGASLNARSLQFSWCGISPPFRHGEAISSGHCSELAVLGEVKGISHVAADNINFSVPWWRTWNWRFTMTQTWVLTTPVSKLAVIIALLFRLFPNSHLIPLALT